MYFGIPVSPPRPVPAGKTCTLALTNEARLRHIDYRISPSLGATADHGEKFLQKMVDILYETGRTGRNSYRKCYIFVRKCDEPSLRSDAPAEPEPDSPEAA